MANEPCFRDLSKLDYIPAFNDQTVARIQRVSLISAICAGLFGILYFSLAPAAMSTIVEVSVAPLSGQDCKMISAVSRSIKTFELDNVAGVNSKKSLDDWAVEVDKAGESLQLFTYIAEPAAAAPGIMYNQLEPSNFKYSNVLFDSYEACLNSAKIHTTCKWTSSEKLNTIGCSSQISCSSLTLNGLMQLTTDRVPFTFDSNQTLLKDPRYGKCNDKANVTLCANINENCQGLSDYLSTYQELIRRFVLRPESICQPFLKNPPYLCSKTSSLNVPSILSQSFSFATTALAGVQTVCFFVVKMLRNRCVVESSDTAQTELQPKPTKNAV
jgi:hypothetical protein